MRRFSSSKVKAGYSMSLRHFPCGLYKVRNGGGGLFLYWWTGSGQVVLRAAVASCYDVRFSYATYKSWI